MKLRYPRRLAITLVALLVIVFSGLYLAPIKAQTLRATPVAQTARTLPHRTTRTMATSPGIAPAAAFPATMTEKFEGAWPAPGWSLQDFGTSGGEYLFGKRNCQPLSGSYAAWAGGGGASGASLACGDDYANNVYSIATYGPFDLTDAASSVLSYSFRGASERGSDELFVAASIDDYYYWGNSYSGDYSSAYAQGTLDLSDLHCSGVPSSLLGRSCAPA